MEKTYLDLSTAHVTQPTMQKLSSIGSDPTRRVVWEDTGWPAMTVAEYAEGVFITVPHGITAEQMDALPSDLEEVFSYAHMHGAEMVRLDADGHCCADLTTYDW